MTSNKSNINLVDPRIKRELEQDFRRIKKFDSPALNFKDWVEYKSKNKEVIILEAYARSILSHKHETSLKSMIRIMNRFSGATVKVQKEVIETLLTNDIWVKAEIRLKSRGNKLELDPENSFLILTSKPIENKINNVCYQ